MFIITNTKVHYNNNNNKNNNIYNINNNYYYYLHATDFSKKKKQHLRKSKVPRKRASYQLYPITGLPNSVLLFMRHFTT